MKKVIAFLITISMVLSILTACSSTASKNPESQSTQVSTAPANAQLKMYPSNFKATGAQADLYNQKLNYFNQNWIPFFEKKGETSKIVGYEKPLKVKMINYYSTTLNDAVTKWGKDFGETFNQNRYTDAIKRAFNIDIEYKWWAPDAEYNQKLRLDMTANDLPDVFMVRTQTDLQQLVAAGAIQDLTDMIDKNAYSSEKEIWESDKGTKMKMATFDGRIYGLPTSISDTDFFSYIWIRSDWLTKSGLSYPKTFDDLTKLIKTFANSDFDGNGKKDTVGLAIDKTLYYGTRGIFNGFSAYPEVWVEKNGRLEWGGVDKNNKGALTYLNSLYKQGLLDPEFVTYNDTKRLEAVLNGLCGIVYGGHWLGHTMGDLHEKDANSDWVCVPMPSVDGKPVKSPLNPTYRGWTVVNTNFKNPEALFKIRTLSRYTMEDKDGDWWWYDQNVGWQISPVLGSVNSFDNLFTWQNVMEAYNANNNTSLLRGKAIPYWANLHGDLKWEWELMFGNREQAAMRELDYAYKNNLMFYNAYYGIPSDFMQERWSTIRDEQLISFIKMIIGEVNIDSGFDTWINNFNSMGGNQITKEVNDWRQKNK